MMSGKGKRRNFSSGVQGRGKRVGRFPLTPVNRFSKLIKRFENRKVEGKRNLEPE